MSLKERVESEGFGPVLRELEALVGEGDWSLRLYIGTAARIAENRAARASAAEPDAAETERARAEGDFREGLRDRSLG